MIYRFSVPPYERNILVVANNEEDARKKLEIYVKKSGGVTKPEEFSILEEGESVLDLWW